MFKNISFIAVSGKKARFHSKVCNASKEDVNDFFKYPMQFLLPICYFNTQCFAVFAKPIHQSALVIASQVINVVKSRSMILIKYISVNDRQKV